MIKQATKVIRETGAQIRSILLGVIEFITVETRKNIETTQIPIPEIDFRLSKPNPDSARIIAMKNKRIMALIIATTRILDGYLPGYFPPMEAFPQGIPAAKKS